MKFLSRNMVAPIVLAASFAGSAGLAHAQTTAEVVCREEMSDSLAKFVKVVFKDMNACHKKRSSGKLPLTIDCNQALLIPGNKSTDAYAKAAEDMLSACPPGLLGVLGRFARCPTPHSTLDDDGATTGIDDFGEAIDCILNLAVTTAGGASANTSGRPVAVPSPDVATCQHTIGKVTAKHIATIGKVRSGCQSAADAAQDGLGYSCATFDDGKIAKSRAKLASLIHSDCDLPLEELATLVSCGQTPDQLEACVGLRVAQSLGGGLAAEAYELPDTCKLGRAELAINAGRGERRTVTKFDTGYNGLGHGVDLMDGFRGAVDLACDDDCTGCVVTIAPVKDQGKANCRCDSDPTIHCDTISAPDADDCGGGNCTCMFGPPLPLSAAGTPACVVNKIVQELDGVADGGTGVSTTSVANTAVVYLGDSQFAPCPLCGGDPTPNDGVRGGTCDGGRRDGLACDENGESPDFGPLSYECPPAAISNVSGGGLTVAFALTSVESPTIAATLTDGGNPVFCLQCSGDTTVGCNSDAECAALGVGSCTVNTSSIQAKANSCIDGICTVTSSDANEVGTCLANASDAFCDGILRASGKGLLPCLDSEDCAAYDAICPGGDCGSCSALQGRSCLPDPFGAVGTHGVLGSSEASGLYGADLVSTFCIAPTSNYGINSSVGLPGPGRLLIDFDFDGRCASDTSVLFEPPGGSNCP